MAKKIINHSFFVFFLLNGLSHFNFIKVHLEDNNRVAIILYTFYRDSYLNYKNHEVTKLLVYGSH